MQENIALLIAKKSTSKGKLISIIMPLYNEESSIPFVLEELTQFLPKNLPNYNFEITFIDDCSKDNSYSIIKQASQQDYGNVKFSIAQLAKNSGSHIAITAGINLARGEFVVIMASDGQDPAEVILQLVREWENGNDLILASRKDNLDQSIISKKISNIAWKLMNWGTGIRMPETGCDLLGMDKKVAFAFNKMDERNTTFIFRILSLGFKQKEIQYIKRARVAGVGKWTFIKKISIMVDAITGFSSRPLKLITNIGLTVFVVLLFRWVYIMYTIYILKQTATDRTIIVNTIFTALAVQVLILGVIGNYIWRVLDESRKRPLYEINKIDGQTF